MNLAFGFILKNIEDGGFYRNFYAHENAPLDRSKLVCTKDDLAKLKDNFNKTNVPESCRRERMNLKWRFYKLTFLTVFATFLWVARTLFYPNLGLKIAQLAASRMKGIQDSHTGATCVFFVLLLSICMENNNRKKKLQNFSSSSKTEWMESVLISSR